MKKIFAVLLIIVMFMLTACTPNANVAEPSPEPSPIPIETPSPEPLATPTEEPTIADMVVAVRSAVRYVFEQDFLPDIVYVLERENVIAWLQNLDAQSMEALLLNAWGFVAEMFLEYAANDGIELVLGASRENFGLSDRNIVSVTAEAIREDVNAFIIKMLDIEEFLRCTYIAITYHGTNGLQIFTVEQSHGFHMFCFISENARGSFFEIENTPDAFIEAILEVIDDIDAHVGAGLRR